MAQTPWNDQTTNDYSSVGQSMPTDPQPNLSTSTDTNTPGWGPEPSAGTGDSLLYGATPSYATSPIPPTTPATPAAISQPYAEPMQGPPTSFGALPAYDSPSYGTTPGYGSAPAYGVEPAYGAPYGQHAMPYPMVIQSMVPEKPKTKTLGVVGMVMVIVAGVLGSIFSYQLGGAMAEVFPPDWWTSGNIAVDNLPPHLQDQLMSLAAPPMLLGGIASLLGIAGFIVSIVATAKGNGRGFGVAGIILGIIAPLVMLFALYVPILAVI